VRGVASQGHVFVITGPSGVGKGTLIRGLMERMPELELSVSATTRSPRPGERQGIDYHFLSPAEFGERRVRGEFVEDVDYAGSSYGTLRSELEGRARSGAPVVLEIEVQGARKVRRALPTATQIFIAPPSLEELRRRLSERGTDDPEKVDRRLLVAREELAARDEFAYVVLNDELERALEELEAVVRRELGG
jgi:guanylate kinase